MGRIWKDKQLLAAAVLFAVFIANVVIGKIAVLGGATTVPGLGDVGEFLVLFAAVVLFIAVCLRREAAAEHEAKNEPKEKGDGDVQ
ncbi:hypothetical protein [Pelagibius sp.]|uniref:hypothetical protein n=1 Tax=Pelagibius sp. TaxID=1931238 RepID=UPI00262A80F4|nr:hypothetical protein [Pelagibius sp.]